MKPLGLAIGFFLTAMVHAADFAASIERANGADLWQRQGAFQTDIVVQFGGRTVIDGTLTMEPPVGRTRLDLKNGTIVVYDGKDVWVSPPDADFPRARFHALTWPYFVAAPMKLRDPGTHLELMGELPLKGQSLPAAKLTFSEGVGDTPDDWYILYRDAQNHLAAMAYVVTYGKSAAEANKAPHAITYEQFKNIQGVRLATRWQFWNWNKASGIVGEPIGEATLTNFRFIPQHPALFEKPADARRDDLPAED